MRQWKIVEVFGALGIYCLLWNYEAFNARERKREICHGNEQRRGKLKPCEPFFKQNNNKEKKSSSKRQPDDQCLLRLPFDSKEGTTNRTTAIKNLERRENRSMQSYTYNRKAFDIMPHKINTPNNKLGKKKRPHSFCHKIVKLDSCHLLSESVLLSLDCCMFVLCCVQVLRCVCVCFGWCTKRLSL